MSNCYNTNDSTMLTSEEFKRSESFEGWDFEKTWKMSQKAPEIPVLRALYK
jgi:hypothetical protein